VRRVMIILEALAEADADRLNQPLDFDFDTA
jgi:hypothetical protein